LQMDLLHDVACVRALVEGGDRDRQRIQGLARTTLQVGKSFAVEAKAAESVADSTTERAVEASVGEAFN